jgi:hypothetical protein
LSTRAEFLERFSGSANHNFKLKSAAIYNSFDVTVVGIALELRRGPKVEFRNDCVEGLCAPSGHAD